MSSAEQIRRECVEPQSRHPTSIRGWRSRSTAPALSFPAIIPVSPAKTHCRSELSVGQLGRPQERRQCVSIETATRTLYVRFTLFMQELEDCLVCCPARSGYRFFGSSQREEE